MRIEEVDATITAESLPPVEADPNQVAVNELVDNAVAYGGDDVEIELSVSEAAVRSK